MNVLQINLSDYTWTGGTGIAMHRLHGGLKAGGHQSKIFCLIPELGDPETIYFERSLPVKVIERGLLAIENELGLNNCGRIISTINIRNRSCYKEASVLQLHCIHGAFISYLGLPWLTAKPTIYTMHDMWGFTGHCHYSYDCDRNEAFGIVSTESMACGTDVVAFNASGVSDAVRPGITGLLAERENVEQLRDHIVQLLEDEALPLSISTKCRAIPTLRVLRSRSVPVGAAALFTVRVACPLGLRCS
jgi:hypothetical protein